jgi:tetratricopeptide (TPR) repeat protein
MLRKVLFVLVLSAGVTSSVYSQAGAAAFRTINVVSEPGAIVWLDDVRYGKTDRDGKFEIRTVSTGNHILRLRADGFKQKTQPVGSAVRGEVRVPLVKTTDEAELSYQEAERLTDVDREKSADAYRKAIKLRPNYPEAQLGLARVLMEAQDLDGAKTAVAAARRLRPGYAEASAVEGRIHKEYGDDDKAAAAFKRSIMEAKGFQPEAYTGLGLLYKDKAEGFGGSGDFANEAVAYDEAAKNLKTALKQLSGAPDAIVLYQLLGLVYERQKKNSEAIALYEEFLRLFPNVPEATSVRSFIVQLKKDQPQ